MTEVQKAVARAVAKHGTLRAAARVFQVDPGYLQRLLTGEKDAPGDPLLRKLGLRKVVTYVNAAPPLPGVVAVGEPTVIHGFEAVPLEGGGTTLVPTELKIPLSAKKEGADQ